MTLITGTRFGPYEITAPIGAGGMGEVYRAHDHKLQRDVAIKVLPDDVGHDPERLARFEREARASFVDVAPDGQRFLLLQQEPAPAPSAIAVVSGWLEDLESKR